MHLIPSWIDSLLKHMNLDSGNLLEVLYLLNKLPSRSDCSRNSLNCLSYLFSCMGDIWIQQGLSRNSAALMLISWYQNRSFFLEKKEFTENRKLTLGAYHVIFFGAYGLKRCKNGYYCLRFKDSFIYILLRTYMSHFAFALLKTMEQTVENNNCHQIWKVNISNRRIFFLKRSLIIKVEQGRRKIRPWFR